MPLSPQSDQERSILAVVVLYKRSPDESQSVRSLLSVLNENPEYARRFALILYDNSPNAHTIDSLVCVPAVYNHRPDNPGLSAAYNFALEQADRNGQKWLLLLDQDTTLSVSFVRELIECLSKLDDFPEVASIIPRLIAGTRLLSPEASFMDQIKQIYQPARAAIRHDVRGLQKRELVAYNSGATLRVTSLKQIGGFPNEFWLDYLDHAVFHALFCGGFLMFVMDVELEHQTSQANLSEVPEWRQRNILMAQTLFVKKNGSFLDRLLYRRWVLRYSRSLWLRCPHRRLWKEALWHALLLSTGKPGLKP